MAFEAGWIRDPWQGYEVWWDDVKRKLQERGYDIGYRPENHSRTAKGVETWRVSGIRPGDVPARPEEVTSSWGHFRLHDRGVYRWDSLRPVRWRGSIGGPGESISWTLVYSEQPVRPETTATTHEVQANAAAAHLGYDVGRARPVRRVLQPLRLSESHEAMAARTLTERRPG